MKLIKRTIENFSKCPERKTCTNYDTRSKVCNSAMERITAEGEAHCPNYRNIEYKNNKCVKCGDPVKGEEDGLCSGCV